MNSKELDLKIKEANTENRFMKLSYSELIDYGFKHNKPLYGENGAINKDKKLWLEAYEALKKKRQIREEEIKVLVIGYLQDSKPKIFITDLVAEELKPQIFEIYQRVTPFDCEGKFKYIYNNCWHSRTAEAINRIAWTYIHKDNIVDDIRMYRKTVIDWR